MANVEINDLDPKATPALTDEYELQETGGGLSFKSTFQGLANLFTTLFAPLASVVTKATGAELDTGTNDTKFATAKALKDSKNVPSVVPGAVGNVLTSDGTNWASATPVGAIDWANPIAINTATTLTIGKHHVITAATDLAETLPDASAVTNQLISYEVAPASVGLVSLTGFGGQLIDGQNIRKQWGSVATGGETAILRSNGVRWVKVAGKSIPMIAEINSSINTSIPISTFVLMAYDTIISDPAGLADLVNDWFLLRRAGLYSFEAVTGFADATDPTQQLAGDPLGFVQTSMHIGAWPNNIISSLYAEHQVSAVHWMIHTASSKLSAGETVSLQAFSKKVASKITTGSVPAPTRPTFKITEVLTW